MSSFQSVQNRIFNLISSQCKNSWSARERKRQSFCQEQVEVEGEAENVMTKLL